MDITTTVKLNNRIDMPLLGLGTWQATGKDVEQAVLWALEAGYRLIDTAAYYGNENEVGRAVRKSGIPRKDIFITTKLRNDDHDDPEKAFMTSLKKLDSGYIDLYLIHWPVEGLRNNAWKALEILYAEKRCRAIGVSNYTIRHLKELLEFAKVVPAVNQVEFSPYLYQEDLLEFCNKHQIQLEGYSPLTRGKKLDDKKLVEIAKLHGKTPAQVLIKWQLEHGIVVIPKSVKKERIVENAGVFDFKLTKQDRETLDHFTERVRTCWDPSEVE